MSELRNLQNEILWLHNPTVKGRLLRVEQQLGFATHRLTSQVFHHTDDKVVKMLTRLRDLYVAKENATDAILGGLDIDINENGVVTFRAANVETAKASLAIVKACAEQIAQLEAVVDQLDGQGICYFADLLDAVPAARTAIMDREADLNAVIKTRPQMVGGREAESLQKLSAWKAKSTAAEQKIKDAKADLAARQDTLARVEVILAAVGA